MAAVRRPDEPRLPPYRLAHGGRDYGIVAGGKGKHGTCKSVFNVSHVPMHQPIEAFMQARDIERFRRRKVRRAGRAPEGLNRGVWRALDPPPHRRDSRRGDMTAEAVETLHADESAELASTAREQPQETERMTDGDGVFRPALFARGPARHEAEIDQRNLGAVEVLDEASPESGMEAPTMNEDEMHLGASHRLGPRARVACRKDIEQAIDVCLLVRRGEGEPEPRRSGWHGGRPDR